MKFTPKKQGKIFKTLEKKNDFGECEGEYTKVLDLQKI
jgi:hypothetical protein